MAKSISTDQREAPKKAAASPYRLPDTVTPIAYRLTIEPDLEKLTYNGVVEIDLDVRVPTKKVVVNALDLKIVGASLGKVAARTSLDNKKERLTVAVDKPLQKGAATLVVRFAGVISETLRGFYRSSYVAADGSKRWLGATQFEATNARRAFPCFDEPAFKATFEVTILVPEGRTAISNMPVAQPGRAARYVCPDAADVDIPAHVCRRRIREHRIGDKGRRARARPHHPWPHCARTLRA